MADLIERKHSVRPPPGIQVAAITAHFKAILFFSPERWLDSDQYFNRCLAAPLR
jgi:hypothetical protein